MLLALLNLASATAFSVIISLSTFGLYQSYLLAILCIMSARLSGRFQEAPWSLGKLGLPINVFAIVYSTYMAIFMIFPNYLPIDASNMNVSRLPLLILESGNYELTNDHQYALPINALIWIFAVVSWFAWGKKNWPGLNVEVIDEAIADGMRDTKD